MSIFKKTSLLAVRHIVHPEFLGTTAEVAVKDEVGTVAKHAIVGAGQALGHVAEETLSKFVGDWVKKGAEKVRSHFTDHSQAVAEALTQANERAWKSIEVALGGERFRDRFASEDDKALRGQIQTFLESVALPAENPDFLTACLRELRAAREKRLLTTDGLFDPAGLAEDLGPFARFDDPEALLAAECAAVGEVAGELLRLGYRHLGQLLAETPTRGQPLLAMAVQYYFRLEVKKDPALASELTWVKLIAIDQRVQEGLAFVTLLLDRQGQNIDALLEGLAHAQVVLDRVESRVDRTHDVVLNVYSDLRGLLKRLDLPPRELSPRHSYSCQDDRERRLAAAVLRTYRNLPEDQRRRHPQLLLDFSTLEIALGDYPAAGRDASQAAEWLETPADQAVGHHNRYISAKEERDWETALQALRQAVALDPSLAPWPDHGFEIERILGAGGFAVAFLARKPHLKGHVVFKTFRAEGIDREVEEVFKEAEILENLHDERHVPGIVRLLECGYADPARKRRPYLKLEHFKDSLSLEDHVRQHRPLTPDDLLSIAVQTAEALRAAHEAGVLHRDVKPGNLLVRKSARGWEVKVIDFGLSVRRSLVQISQNRAATQGRSMVGSAVAGTLHYAAPEQLDDARTHEVGPHSDVYGFGRTCFYAFFAEPEPDLHEIASLPRPWYDFLGRCTAKKIDRRPRDFDDVLKRLRAMASPTPQPAAPIVAAATPPVPAQPAPKPASIKESSPAAWAGSKAGDLKVVRVNDQEIRFRWCPAGSFTMGSPTTEKGRSTDEGPVKVTLSRGFWMQETQVTQGLWRNVMRTKLDWSSKGDGPNLPVYNVSHGESEEFGARLTELLRADEQIPSALKLVLPTEAQWEYAARAGTTTRFPFGDDEGKLGEYAWYSANSGGKPHDVKTRQPNAWKLHDMLGNVWEWCADWYVDRLPGGVDPCPSGASSRVFRGGGWGGSPAYCRPADRIRLAPDIRNCILGFRLAAVQLEGQAGKQA